jgi:hypothetical protein
MGTNLLSGHDVDKSCPDPILANVVRLPGADLDEESLKIYLGMLKSANRRSELVLDYLYPK